MTTRSIIFTAGLCLLAPLAARPQSGDVPEPKAARMFDVQAMDKTVDPCVNFYQYACGNWRKENPVPSDQAMWGRFNELNERNRWLTYQILLKAEQPSPGRSALQQKYGDYFAACMNVEQANAEGAKPIEPLLRQIADLRSTSQIPALIAEMQSKKATPVLFHFGSTQDVKNSQEQIAEIGQGGLGLPDRDYYLGDDEHSKKVRADYVEHMTAMFKLLGDTPEAAAKEADSVMAFETGLAKASQTRTAMRDPENTYHRMTLTGLEQLAPNFNWQVYLTQVGSPKLTNNVTVESPDFLKQVNDDLKTTDLSVWRSYLRWHAVHAAAPWLSDQFSDERFRFFGVELSGQKQQQARWKRCTAQTDHSLGEAVGQDWVQQNFGGDAKANMQKLVGSIEQALNEDIAQLDWMTPATKAEAEKKLAAIRNKIGYPDKWRDYSSVVVTRDNFIEDVDHAAAFNFQRDVKKIGKPVDESEWSMTPPTVNAYYDDGNNDINFPAGILQPPFYSNSANIAQNLGAIGVIIGHEITHGFDDQGSKFDAKGNLREWYTPADRKGFDERTDCEVKEYDNFEPVSGVKLNGKLTLGENTADNGGLRLAYIALMDTLSKNPNAAGVVDGYTPQQQLFLSFAQDWCENNTEQASRLLAKIDPHSPGEFRVNGAVQNFDEFGKAFGCKVGQPMMPLKSCRVW
jgi:putative endopeptidase